MQLWPHTIADIEHADTVDAPAAWRTDGGPAPARYVAEIDAFVRPVAERPDALASVTTLVLRPTGPDRLPIELASGQLGRVPNLRTLVVSAAPLRASDLPLLLDHLPPKCATIRMTDNGLGSDVLDTLVAHPTFDRVRHLGITHNPIARVSERAAEALLAGSLRSLSLMATELGGLDFVASVSAADRRLDALDVSANHVPVDADILWPALRSLDVSSTGTMLSALAGARHPLERLGVGNSALWDEEVDATFSQWSFPWLRQLALHSSGIDDGLLVDILDHPWHAPLEALDLSVNGLTGDGLLRLAESEQGARLTRLDLAWNDIDDDGLRALAALPRERPWQWLRLDHNPVTEVGRRALAESPWVTPACRAALLGTSRPEPRDGP